MAAVHLEEDVACNRTEPRLGGQPAQTVGQGEPALGEPVAGAGRDCQVAVDLRDGGSRRQRPSDVAVAARLRQPDVAGAERVAQVERGRLPEAGIGLRA